MSSYYFSNIPPYHWEGFSSVRDVYDNLQNVLNFVDAVNCCPHCRTVEEKDIDFAIFTGGTTRILIRKEKGYYSMNLPFQIIDSGEIISFNYNEFNMPVSGQFISIMKSCIQACRDYGYSHEDVISSAIENFSLDYRQAVNYCDVFTTLLSEDHGYFRFDDDLKGENGRVHPRYHFDIFFRNSTSIKIGVESEVDFQFFKSLFDKQNVRPYLT